MRYSWVAVLVLAGCGHSTSNVAGEGSKADKIVDRIAQNVAKPPQDPDDAWKKKEEEAQRLAEELLAEAGTPAGKEAVRQALDRKIQALKKTSPASPDTDYKLWALIEMRMDEKLAQDPEAARLVADFGNAVTQAEQSSGNPSTKKHWTDKMKEAEAGLRGKARTADGKKAVLEAIDLDIAYNEVKLRIEPESPLESVNERLKELKKSLG